MTGARVAYNRGRFELASQIEKAIGLAATVDAHKLRETLYAELGGDDDGQAPTHVQRNAARVDTRLPLPDYVGHRVTGALDNGDE